MDMTNEELATSLRREAARVKEKGYNLTWALMTEAADRIEGQADKIRELVSMVELTQ